MGIELLYHGFDSSSDISPFNDALNQVSDSDSLAVACPYISLDILQDLTAGADSWRLVTDLAEWTRTQSPNQREAIVEFVQEHRESIHDCRDLHAKLVVGDDGAFLGSANLTDNGLNRNAELAVHLQDTTEIAELQGWFDELWSQTESTDLSQLKTYIEETDGITTTQSTVKLPNTGPSINTSLSLTKQTNISVDDSHHDKLVAAVERAPSRAWIDTYFDWVDKLIEFTELKETDERIATTVPSPERIPVNVNQRYVLTAFPEQGKIGLMLPGDSTAVEELAEYISDFGQFSTPSSPDPYWFEFPDTPENFISEEIETDWERSVKQECKRAGRSSHRNSHNPAVYKAAVDRQYRRKVLRSVFSL